MKGRSKKRHRGALEKAGMILAALMVLPDGYVTAATADTIPDKTAVQDKIEQWIYNTKRKFLEKKHPAECLR